MAHEIELKLDLPVSAQRRFLRHPLLRTALSRHTQTLINRYFDTPSLELHRRAIALRLRKQGRIWLQTVKSAGNSIAGLSSRPEWETPYSGHFDFSSIDAEPLRHWLERPKLNQQLIPLFETNFQRITWRFEPQPGCLLLLTLDRGWIEAGGRREMISELEIELASPEHPQGVNEIFRLAHKLGEHVPLLPSNASKAERGYRLFLDKPVQPRKACPTRLQADTQPPEMFHQLVQECLSHLQDNQVGALQSNINDSDEFIHQARIATRRLRTILRLFDEYLSAPLSDECASGLRHLAQKLAHTRNLEILQADIVSPVAQKRTDDRHLANLAALIQENHKIARENALIYLQSLENGQFMLQLTDQLHRPLPDSGDNSARSAKHFIASQLERLFKKVHKRSRQADPAHPPRLHRLRISIKNLRYALEFFLPQLNHDKSLLRHWQRLLVKTDRLQELLGAINDSHQAETQLRQIANDAPHLSETVALVGAWHAAAHQERMTKLKSLLQELDKIRLPRLKNVRQSTHRHT